MSSYEMFPLKQLREIQLGWQSKYQIEQPAALALAVTMNSYSFQNKTCIDIRVTEEFLRYSDSQFIDWSHGKFKFEFLQIEDRWHVIYELVPKWFSVAHSSSYHFLSPAAPTFFHSNSTSFSTTHQGMLIPCNRWRHFPMLLVLVASCYHRAIGSIWKRRSPILENSTDIISQYRRRKWEPSGERSASDVLSEREERSEPAGM